MLETVILGVLQHPKCLHKSKITILKTMMFYVLQQHLVKHVAVSKKFSLTMLITSQFQKYSEGLGLTE